MFPQEGGIPAVQAYDFVRAPDDGFFVVRIREIWQKVCGTASPYSAAHIMPLYIVQEENRFEIRSEMPKQPAQDGKVKKEHVRLRFPDIRNDSAFCFFAVAVSQKQSVPDLFCQIAMGRKYLDMPVGIGCRHIGEQTQIYVFRSKYRLENGIVPITALPSAVILFFDKFMTGNK